MRRSGLEQVLGVLVRNVVQPASHLDFAGVVPKSVAGGTHQPHWQQLAEPDSPRSLSLCYTHVAPSMKARCRARARGLAQKGYIFERFAFIKITCTPGL